MNEIPIRILSMFKARMAFIIGIMVVIEFSGCESRGTDFPSGNVKSLEPGMTTEQVADTLFGPPYAEEFRKTRSVESILHYYYYESENTYTGILSQHRLYLEFADDTLNGYVFESSFPDESTDFERKPAASLKVNLSTRRDAEKILNPPSGCVNGETNLIGAVFGKDAASKMTDSISQAWTYFYFYHVAGGVDTTKVLILYFDSSGVVKDKYYSENTKR